MEKVYDYVTACSSRKGIISDMKVFEDFESMPPQAVTIVVERGKERQEWNEQKLPKRYQDTLEEGYLEEERKRIVGRKEKNAKKANKGRKLKKE